MNKYNDGLDNETLRQIITTYRRPLPQKTKDIIKDLGTSITVDKTTGEMYSNSNSNCENNSKENCNTFRPDRTVNVVGGAHELPSQAFGPEVREEKEIGLGLDSVVGKRDQKNLNPNYLYTHIEAQLTDVRCVLGNNRYRAKMLFSLKTEDDLTFTIKLKSNLTSNINEVIRQANTVKDNPLLPVIQSYKDRNLQELMIGHIKYRSNSGYIGKRERYNHPSALCVLYEENGLLVTELWMFYDIYKIILDNDPTTKQKFAVKTGNYVHDYGYGEVGYDE